MSLTPQPSAAKTKPSTVGGDKLTPAPKESAQGVAASSNLPKGRVSTQAGTVRRAKSFPAFHVSPEKRDEVSSPETTAGAATSDWDSLSPAQREALHNYTSYGHALSRKLRLAEPLTAQETQHVQDIDSAIEILSKRQNRRSRALTLRGIPPAALTGVPRLGLRPGDVVTDPAYLSSTSSVDVALEKAFNGDPRQPDGNLLLLSTSGGADVRNVAAHDVRREAEVLGPRNKSLRCAMAYGQTYMQVPLNVAYLRETEESLVVDEEPRPLRKARSLRDIADIGEEEYQSFFAEITASIRDDLNLD